MHLRILVCDLDGTLTEHDEVATETWDALRQAKTAGFSILLATGRRLETFDARGLFAELCEAIIAEDGAVVYFPRRDTVELPFGQLNPMLFQRLERLEIPLEYGMALVATHVPNDGPILNVLREVGGGATVEYNRGAVMVLPAGATKGTGLQYALQELGYSAHNVVACGDAENDRSLFQVAELSVAVANAAPEIQALANLVTPYPNAAGVRWLIESLVDGRIPKHQASPKRYLHLGHDLSEQSIQLDPFTLLNGNLGIFGSSASGKSWLAGLLTEELLKHRYQVCIIDPEGDYRNLHAFPHTLLLGGPDTALPPVVDVVTLSEYSNTNLVLDLSVYDADECICYVTNLLRALHMLRIRRGQPHWILFDEIHNFCPPAGGELNQLCKELMQEGGLGIVSYRPSQVDPALLALLDQWLLTRTRLSEEIDLLNQYLPSLKEKDSILSTLTDLSQGQAYLFSSYTERCLINEDVVTLRTGTRTVPHVRHLHKYLQAPLPTSKRFYFRNAAGQSVGKSAASLSEFCEILRKAPIDSLRYHLKRGDFERWVHDVLNDQELGQRLRKISHRRLHGEELRRALVIAVDERYEELASLA